MPTKSPVAANDPLMDAWQAYRATAEYETMRRWVCHGEGIEDALYAMFIRGWTAGREDFTKTYEEQS